MAKKAPRRTAERILETSQELFNRFGEPNVSTTAISAEMRISPGNLYYHYPAKDELINALFARFEVALREVLKACTGVRTLEDAWRFLRALFELIWQYRFFYRDLNDLMSRNRQLETAIQPVIGHKVQAMQSMLAGMRSSGVLHMDEQDVPDTSTNMIIVATYWLSFEYVRNPRHALEPASAQLALLRGVQMVMNLLTPYLQPEQRSRLASLTQPIETDALAAA
ncbi:MULTISPECIES: TetR/AcrR family transcriptional regulator [unclassified Acidovorax]|uniref:TetR/AcrR family transcriptional regulator n=1 Tax=unclassified Acidovorax TaxID=2684926 RepID=UPI002883218B|nr:MULTISPECIES: TetR/AcrR family transcriptional regulator [unclassified Acidovorax]